MVYTHCTSFEYPLESSTVIAYNFDKKNQGALKIESNSQTTGHLGPALL